MRTPLRTLLVLAAVLAAACGRPAETPGSNPAGVNADSGVHATSGVADTAFTLTCNGLETAILAADPDRAGLRSAWGEPDSLVATTEPNRHIPEAIDSLFTFHYTGLTASFRTPPSARDLISGAVITDNRYLSDARIGIGKGETDLLQRLGEPTRREGDALVYDCGDGAEQPVRFELANGYVTRIVIEYYVD